ncbi:hypothetical protein D3C81_1062600 [compost metagenome]
MLLQIRRHEQDRQGCNYNYRHLDRLVRRRNSPVQLGTVVQSARQHDDLPQQHLDRPFRAVVKIQNGRHVRVPVRYRIKQRDRSDCRHRERQDDFEQDTKIIAAVNAGGLLQALRNVLEEVLEDNHVKRADRGRNNQGGERIDHPQFLDDQKCGNQPAVEQHREDDQEVDRSPAIEILARQSVSHQRRQQHAEHRADQRHTNRNAHRLKDRIGRENKSISFQAPHFRNQHEFIGRELGVRRKRTGHDMNERQHRNQRNDGQQRKIEGSVNPAADRSVLHHQ